ncbi:MAG: TraB/GumN family protein [Trueperaceae bacterium]
MSNANEPVDEPAQSDAEPGLGDAAAPGPVEPARATAAELTAMAGDQPVAVVEHGGVRFTLLGTAHVSKTSAEVVANMANSGGFDAIAIELDQGRYASLTDSQNWQKVDLFKIIRQGKAAMLAVNLALSAFQQRLADQFGIEPGAEMRAAIASAKQAKLPLLLVDRDIGITLRRVYGNMGWWKRLMLLSGLLASVFSRDEIEEEEIERLKEGDILEATFTEFAENSEQMYLPLITERDQYMVSKLITQSGAGSAAPRHKDVLVVIGAGHLKGMRAALEGDGRVPGMPEPEAGQDVGDLATIARLEQLPPPGVWPKLIPWLIVAVLVAGFVIGFMRSPDLGLSLIGDWALISASLAGLGAIIALAHPLTILATVVSSPFTALHPLIGIGPVAALVEVWFRRPSVGDFETLKVDVTTWRGWWRNRAARALLVFVLTTLGGATGTWVALGRIFGRLAG